MSLRSTLALAAVLAAGSALTATPAHADRCEVTELVLRIVDPSYEEPVDEQDNPLCYAMLNYGYYYLCPGGEQGLACFTRPPNPDPTRPFPGVEDYHPEPWRVACDLYNYVTGQLPGTWAVCNRNAIQIWRP